jgi:hypothetical protein
MKRHLVVALAALVILPQLAAAQSGDGLWGPRIRITPFVGISPSFKQIGEVFVATDTDNTIRDYEVRFASGIGMGVAGSFRLWNRFAIIGSGMWQMRDEGEMIDFGDQIVYEIDGSNLWMVKAGMSMSMREIEPDLQLRRLNATVYVAPALVHDAPRAQVWTPASAAQAHTYSAVNFGAEAEMPMANNKIAFVVGLDDYLIFWDETKANTRVQGYFQSREPSAVTAVDLSRSQMVVLRAGLTFRFF